MNYQEIPSSQEKKVSNVSISNIEYVPSEEKQNCCDRCWSTSFNRCARTTCGCHLEAGPNPLGVPSAEWDIRGSIVEMTSTMLDNPKVNIYPTTKFYDRMEAFIRKVVEQAREGAQYGLNSKEWHKAQMEGRIAALKEVMEVVEGMKKQLVLNYTGDIHNKSYNAALSDLKQSITSKLENK